MPNICLYKLYEFSVKFFLCLGIYWWTSWHPSSQQGIDQCNGALWVFLKPSYKLLITWRILVIATHTACHFRCFKILLALESWKFCDRTTGNTMMPCVPSLDHQKIFTLYSKVADPDPNGSPLFYEAGFGSAIEWKAGSGSALESIFKSFRGSKWCHWGLWTLMWRRGSSNWCCWGSVRSSVPDPWHFGTDLDFSLKDPDAAPDPAFLISDLKMPKKIIFLITFRFEGTFTSFFKDKKS